MKKIYIAGPYAAKTEEQKQKNIDQARNAAAELYRKGWAPFCPHTMIPDFDLTFPGIVREVYLETDLLWLDCCDAILMLNGWADSEGAKAELRYADAKGIYRYYAMRDVPDLTVAATGVVTDVAQIYAAETQDMLEWFKREGLPRYEMGHKEYGTKNVAAPALQGLRNAMEEVFDTLFYIRQTMRAMGGDTHA